MVFGRLRGGSGALGGFWRSSKVPGGPQRLPEVPVHFRLFVDFSSVLHPADECWEGEGGRKGRRRRLRKRRMRSSSGRRRSLPSLEEVRRLTSENAQLIVEMNTLRMEEEVVRREREEK